MALITDKDLKRNVKKQEWLTDSAPRGNGRLVAKLKPDNPAAFYFRYTNTNGAQKTWPIGQYHSKGLPAGYSLSEARAAAAEINQVYRNETKDIHGYFETQRKTQQLKAELEIAELEKQKQAAAAVLTLEQAFERWLQTVSYRKDIEEIRRKFKKDILPSIGHMALADVKRSHITDLADEINKRGSPSMAKNAITLLRQLYQAAVEREWVEHDPSVGIRKDRFGGKTRPRKRHLSESEIKELANRLDSSTMKQENKIALWLQLGTLLRSGELLRARWIDIDFDEKRWSLPESHEELHTKTGEPHHIPLSPFVLKLLNQLKGLTGNSAWLFPDTTGEKHIDTKTIGKQVRDRQVGSEANALQKRTSEYDLFILPGGNWRPHDLRRTGSTLMVSMGVLPAVADRCLSHVEANKMHATYQQYEYQKEKFEAWMKLGGLLEILSNPANSNVIQMKPKTA